MNHETTAPVQSLVDDALNELENMADDLDGTYTGRGDGDGLRRAAELIRQQRALIARRAAAVAVPDGLDERLKFEEWRQSWNGKWPRPSDPGEWEAWQARARLSATPAAPAPAAQQLVAVPDGCALVPKKLTPAMIEGALEAHYGKRRVRQAGGPNGVDMTVNGVNYSGPQALRRMWAGALAAAPTPPAAPWESPCTPPAQQPVSIPDWWRQRLGEAASEWLSVNDPAGLDWCDARNIDALLDAMLSAAPNSTSPEQAEQDAVTVPIHERWAEVESICWRIFEDGKKEFRGCTKERLEELRDLLGGGA